MKSHKRGKSVDLGERHRFDSGELGERLIEASNVLTLLASMSLCTNYIARLYESRSRGVIFDGHALFKAAHNTLMSDSSSCTREQSEN